MEFNNHYLFFYLHLYFVQDMLKLYEKGLCWQRDPLSVAYPEFFPFVPPKAVLMCFDFSLC